MATAPKPAPAESLPRSEVLKAFAAFQAACADLVPEDRQDAPQATRDRVLNALAGRR